MRQAYRSYQDSGNTWFGEVPGQWRVLRLGRMLAAAIGGGTPATSNESYWADDKGGIPWVAIADMSSGGEVTATTKRVSAHGQATARLQTLPAGTIIYSMYASVGATARLGIAATTNQAILGLVPKSGLDSVFLYWALTGVRHMVSAMTRDNTQSNLNAETVAKIPLALPPPAEQQAIAGFLDAETARIDELVAKKRLLLERLAEYRTALITRTVTKGLPPQAAIEAGLDPDPPLKPSGIDWLGNIPEHWATSRLKNAVTINDDALPENTDPQRALTYVDIGSVDSTRGITRTAHIVFENAPSRARRTVQHGDTIVSTVRTYLRAIAPIENPSPDLVVSTGFAVVRPRRIDAKFAYWTLIEKGLVDEIVARSVGVSYPAINASELAFLTIPLPPHHEQRAIAEFLDQRTGQIDALVERVEAAIERLQEYRTALITAAVTGRIDVRDYVPANTEADAA